MSSHDEITLDLDIEIQDEEYISSDSDESYSHIDDDDGKNEEFDIENGGAGLEAADLQRICTNMSRSRGGHTGRGGRCNGKLGG